METQEHYLQRIGFDNLDTTMFFTTFLFLSLILAFLFFKIIASIFNQLLNFSLTISPPFSNNLLIHIYSSPHKMMLHIFVMSLYCLLSILSIGFFLLPNQLI